MKNLFKKVLAIGLAASLTLGMAVTSFAEEPAAPKTNENVEVWVNGKDVKANESKGIVADLNKTAKVLLSDLVAAEAATEGVQVGLSKALPDKTKYLFAITEGEKAVTDVFGDDGKVKVEKSKKASVKFDSRSGAFVVTAGKEAGTVEAWIAEYSTADKKVTAYAAFDVAVKMAPAKFSLVIPKGEAPIVKSYTATVGETVNLEVALPEGVTAHADTTYTWSVKCPKNEEDSVTVKGNNNKATVSFDKLSVANKKASFTVTCTNDQSGKKASFKFAVVNNITNVTIGDIAMANAYTVKQETKLALGTDYQIATIGASGSDAATIGASGSEPTVIPSTSKIKLYTSSNLELSSGETFKGYTLTRGEKSDKFKLDEKSKEISAKIDKYGTITVSAKKGTLPGTKAKLVVVVTHADKSIDTYEAIVTVGKVATKIEAGTVEAKPTLLKGEKLKLDPVVTAEDADYVIVLDKDAKKYVSLEDGNTIKGKKAGTAKVAVVSGTVTFEYEITVVNELPAADAGADTTA